MKRAVWAAIVAASVGSTVPALAQDTPQTAAAPTPPASDAATDAAPSPEAAATQAAQGQAGADGSRPANAGGLHADLLGAGIPLRFTLNGYFRTRFDYINHMPLARSSSDTTNPFGDAAFAYMRLRLEPSITYGSDPNSPIVALHSQMDVLNNVVFGDNARLAPTPLFAENPTATGINGTDNNYLYVRRLWLEFLTPIGQIRVGRMASHGGMGLLFNDGNGFRNDWGDANGGSTFDRILFATRPLTIINALTRGDARPTPLVLAVGYDWLVEDPLGVGQDPTCLTGTGGVTGGPCVPARSAFPLGFLANGQQAVQQGILVLAWNDPKINPNRISDELSLGLIGVNRTQGVTSSNVWIYDAFWRARYSVFGNRGIQPFTNGEIYTIQGQSYGVGLKGLTINGDGVTVNPRTMFPTPIHANIWGGAIQAGVAMDDRWQAMVEGGYATGDAHLFDSSVTRGDPTRTLGQRAFSSDYHVGLLLFPIAVQAATANQYAGPLSVLQSNGGVWNASYIYPQVKLRVIPGVEVLGAFLLAWADKLNTVYSTAASASGSPANGNCGPFPVGVSGCNLGWELDLGLRLTWGEHDLMRWSNEFGVAQLGDAILPELHGLDPDGTYHARFLWTFQSRFAMVF